MKLFARELRVGTEGGLHVCGWPLDSKHLRRSVRSCSQTIPEKVRNSRPINMGFKGWG